MIQRTTKRLSLRALVVDDELTSRTAEGRAARALVEELRHRSAEVVEASSAEDGFSVIVSDSAIHAILLDWTLGDDPGHVRARKLLEFVRSRNDRIPVFLMAERGEASSIPIEAMAMVNEFIWTLEDTAAFVGGRVVAAMRRYVEALLPPMAAALTRFSQEYEYSWHTPGHTGGTAFLKSPVGRIFFDFLFSIGITKGKWGTLLNVLLDFKRDYDRNAPLATVLPHLAAEHSRIYADLGLRDLADAMFVQLKETRQTHWLAQAFSTLPAPVMTPSAAYQHLVRGNIEHVPLDQLADRVLATSVVPYPPGIPLLMPGESTGPDDGPYLRYLRALSSWDRRFPGFGHDTHGIENRNGIPHVQCLLPRHEVNAA